MMWLLQEVDMNTNLFRIEQRFRGIFQISDIISYSELFNENLGDFSRAGNDPFDQEQSDPWVF